MKLSKPQKLVYDMQKIAEGSIGNICGSILFDKEYSVGELQNALCEIVRLNDALRIRIKEKDGEIYQCVDEYVPLSFDILSFSDRKELETYCKRFAKEPIVMTGVLYRFFIFNIGERAGVICKIHHLIGDAWTLSLIGTQLNMLLNGETPEAYSYLDYIAGEDDYRQSKRFEKDRLFFEEQFKKCDEATYLNEKHSESYTAERLTYTVNVADTAKITEYANKKGVSVFSLLLSAFSVYVSRVKMNAEKFYIGTAVLNRGSAKEKNTMGMFINTVPVLIEFDNSLSFVENLSRVSDNTFAVLRHQKYNYGDFLEYLREKYHFSEKLYDVIISYQNAKVLGGGVETTWYSNGMQTESLQIHIDDRDDEGILKINYDYLTEKFTSHEIEMLHAHLFHLLFDAMENDQKKIYELEMLTGDEKQKLLFDFNDTAVDYPKDKCIHQLFEEQVEKTPNKTAIIACDKTLTYKELNEEANRIAHSLIEKGICVGDIVAFALPRKSYLISTMLGILKSGAAYLPIDPDYPQDRIEYMLEDSNAKLFITDDNIVELLLNKDATNTSITMSSIELCYCIYTSGSTGFPKAVLINHNNLVNFCCNNTNNYFQKTFLSECNNIISFNNVIFDIVDLDFWLPLLNGKKITFIKNIYDYQFINKTFADYNTGLNITPTKIQMFLSNSIFCKKLKYVSVIMIGAEKLHSSLVKKIKQYTNAIIFNGYGPTETTCGTLFKEITEEKDTSIGKPIANTQIYIVDKYMRLTPIGVTGELCIAGDGVGAGYLNRPELTAEKFIDNPFGDGKLYKTGDLAYWREDGNIMYVGRNDFQVKIRGLRIELGEIENAISSIDGISQSVVLVRKNSEGRQLICAFYTGKAKEATEIKKVIGTKLPKYMLPHIFTHIDEMPLTPSGKVNRRALPEIDLENIESNVEYVAPVTEKEFILVSAVQSVLGAEKISILDNFFDIGGDSLKAIELISKLEAKGFTTDTKTIFDCENIKDLAKKITEKKSAKEKAIYENVVAATPAQMRVYTAQNMNSGSTLYNIPYVFRTENLNCNRLETAINKLISRHESIRTHFENRNGEIVQVIERQANITVQQLESEDILSFVKPFDLSKSPLLRVGYFENTVMIDMHHIISDGGTMPVFFKELNELYMGRKVINEPVQYGEFAITIVDSEEDEKYWLSVFNDEIPVLEINTDYPRTDKQSFNGAAVYDSISIETHKKITEKCKALGVTPYVFYMAAFNILLSKYSGNEDIIVGMPVSGRTPEYLDTVGMFVNTVALRNQSDGNKTVKDFLLTIKENSVKAMEHQAYPFGSLVKKLGIENNGRNPLFDVMFAYQSEVMTDIVFGDRKAELLPVPITTAKCDLSFYIMPRENEVVIMTEYCTDLYKRETIEKIVMAYKTVLNGLFETDKKLYELSAAPEEEYRKLLYDFNNTAVDYPKDKCVHQLFEEQVDKTPDKTAIIACDKTLSYKELNEEANRIAHSLIEKGIGVGDIVAFALPRKSYLIAAMFGILKAGAAYLPIDPDYPKDRIEYMLEDSGAKLFVTEENITDLLQNIHTDDPNIAMSSNNPCYCIYTSGSTGKPKGVVLCHCNVANYVNNNNNNNNVVHSIIKEEYETIVSVTTVGFDIFVTESLLPLTNGMTTVFADERQSKLQSELNALLKAHPADVMQTTPTKMKMLISDKKQLDYLQGLKVIILGGEALDENLVTELKRLTDAKIFNIYGPTETTVWSTNKKMTGGDTSIGKPIANTQIYIVDKYMRLTPIGVTGELCIAGDGVGAGYLNRPELTAEKFIDNPFGDGKLYKTGDLAYWREDGNIMYVGRNDFQVKIRGLRIELGEIENAISSVDGIGQSVVIVRKNSEDRQLICAFYTGEEKEVSEIKRSIGEKLPKYMLPHIFTHIDEMPLTSSGKVNRKAMPEIDLENIALSAEYVPPVTELQKALCGIMAQVLGVEKVGLTDNFFELGGDSLKAIELIANAQSDGIQIELQSIFDAPKVGELAGIIEKGSAERNTYDPADFETVHKLLADSAAITQPMPESEVGNVLITGATGFLGVHILAEYLETEQGVAYCLVRGKDETDAQNRLQKMLDWYFGGKYSSLLGGRIKVLCGDVQKENLGLDTLPAVGMLIHTAASVKHYGSYRYFYDINVGGTINAMNAAKALNAKLIHISTISVSGNAMVGVLHSFVSEKEMIFTEKNLYIGQGLDNVYIRSKFEAEKAVLDEIAAGRLKGNIIRVGNLTNRASDLIFQPNYESNAFLSRFRAILALKALPDYMLPLYSEFSPVDDTAKGIMLVARHFSEKKVMYHVYSNKNLYLDRMTDILISLGYPVKILSTEQFADHLRATEEKMPFITEALINDTDENGRLVFDSNVHIKNDLSREYLSQFGFDWTEIDMEYIRDYIAYFSKLGYFGGNKVEE